jgi:rhodanese-related sulfurtransferase
MTTLASDHLSPQQLQARLGSDNPPLLVDVREYPEFAGGHVSGAQLLPLAELESRAGELPRDREIVTVCRSGRRSADAAEKLARLGFPQVGQLAGGVMAWEAAGLPLERDSRAPWALERQVRFVAGLLVLSGLALSFVWPAAIALGWFVALGLIFAAVTDSCAMGMLIAKLPWNRRSAPACAFGNARP